MVRCPVAERQSTSKTWWSLASKGCVLVRNVKEAIVPRVPKGENTTCPGAAASPPSTRTCSCMGAPAPSTLRVALTSPREQMRAPRPVNWRKLVEYVVETPADLHVPYCRFDCEVADPEPAVVAAVAIAENPIAMTTVPTASAALRFMTPPGTRGKSVVPLFDHAPLQDAELGPMVLRRCVPEPGRHRNLSVPELRLFGSEAAHVLWVGGNCTRWSVRVVREESLPSSGQRPRPRSPSEQGSPRPITAPLLYKQALTDECVTSYGPRSPVRGSKSTFARTAVRRRADGTSESGTSVPRRTRAASCCSSPAGSSSWSSARASSRGSRGPLLRSCSPRTPRPPGRGGNSWSRRDQP